MRPNRIANPNPSITPGRRSEQSSSSEEDASIYFRVMIEGREEWYVIKGDSTTPEGKYLYPHLSPEPKPLMLSGLAVIGSTIYALGGTDREYAKSHPYLICPPNIPDVHYIDTLRPKDGWKTCPPMNKRRSRPQAVSFDDGKIYVFGGMDEYPTTPCPEVFDPRFKDQGWSLLQDNLSAPFLFNGHAVLDGIIMLYTCGFKEIFSYDVEADSWGVYSQNFSLFRGTSAFVDGILYFFDKTKHRNFFGFDLSKPDSAPKLVNGLMHGKNKEKCRWMPEPDSDGDYTSVYMVSLGNEKLAVVWEDRLYHGSEVVVHIYCSKIKMSKPENTAAGEVEFVGHPLSLKCYKVKGNMLLGCVAVFPSQKMEGQEDVRKDDNTTATNDKNKTSSSSSSSNNNNNNNDKNRRKRNKKN